MFHLSSPGQWSADSSALWSDPRAPVVRGTSVGTTHRVVSDGPVRMAVVGNCYATDRQLRDGLHAARSGQWSALTTWPGSYWAVADDGDTTAVITDVAGTRPVYFAETPDRTHWSTSAQTLALRIGARVDHASVIARLVCATVPEVTGNGSAFQGVRRLAGGHALVIHRDGQHSVEEYEKPRTLHFAEAAAELREALITAVTSRAAAARKLTADFSGGLDSTSLVLLATGIAGAEVLAVTDADATSTNEDVAYAQRAATGQPGLHHELVTDAEGLFFAGLLDAPATDQPFPDAARWRMRAAYQRPCIGHGSDTHLTGSGADTLLATSPYYLADLAQARDISALISHSLARARLRHLPMYAVVAAAVRLSRTTHAAVLRQLAHEITTDPAKAKPEHPARLHWVRASGLHSWLTPQARHALSTRAAIAAEHCTVQPSHTSRHRAWAELREFGTYEAELRNQAHAQGLPHHAPYLDNAVVRAAMAIPTSSRASTTLQKPLLGAALHGLVPDWLLQRRTKGAYDGNAYTGLRHHVTALRDLLTTSELAAEGWIDASAACAELDRLAAGVPGKLAALEALIAAELWLRQHRSRATTSETTEVSHV
ncbi:albusnodin/ikarugamycin family macrolactam cyclase [Streptomyces halobius]|uniref:asparagine synthase (glutamine-hydrolyzing) n=1 Tax=Streptomyces halobius TaxID=2879846 RepID=A0ABY4M3V6_9ACTN|nr:albusnodin/ikarugamycin family macrolactam cyclase [Streptomyces halobius]UQA91529.1 albusnodin/ikarugamycin family macrolactam cyclase [Streptomyces halobius]